ncbi:MAG: CoA transferase [Deltaproteobacteria bacterium]|nr:CoA transferase [Deltaproteobacteria bacterium]MBN2687998.1 CoA transferase [Deltaproteobacteria bacterium]
MSLPLDGINVLDLSSLLPGSLCSQMLADLGAEVLKIENPSGGDNFRSTPPIIRTTGSYFHMINRNKKGITLNLKHEQGRAIFMKLVPGADVVLDSCAPGSMEAMGLGYEDLKKENTRIICCSLTGFGQDGPYKHRPAHDIDFLSISGILDLLGGRGGPPVVPAVQFAGAGGGLSAAMGILAALLRRERTGEGQYLDVAILDSLTPFLSLVMSQFMADGTLPKRGESLVGGGYAFYNIYETADGKYLSLGCLEEKFWKAFCRAVRREDLIDDQYAPSPRREALIEEVKGIFRQKTRDEWITLFDEHTICYSPVNSLEDAVKDPQIRHRGLWFSMEHPTGGTIPQQRFPVEFSDDRPQVRCHPPDLGEHTREILHRLGYTGKEIDDFYARGIV